MTADELSTVWWHAMLAGDFEQAWSASDSIRAMELPDPNRFWNGEDFRGKRVMVRCLHGFGDTVQFLRYLPLLRAQTSSVCVEVAPEMVELAQCLDGVERVITWGKHAPAVSPEYDVQMEVMELPYVFRTKLSDLPLTKKYLHTKATESNENDLLDVGIVWTVGEWNPVRGIAIELLEPLFTLDGCRWWNLTTNLAPAGPERMLQEDQRSRQSLMGLAQRIATLDLVITVDTLAAHVAGAMGIPAWVMLQHHPDWRWMNDRDDSPWYPSLRLFRQSQSGDWQGVVQQIRNALMKLIVERHSEQ